MSRFSLTTVQKTGITLLLPQRKEHFADSRDVNVVFQVPTLSQQLVSLAHPMLNKALAVIQRFDAVCLDGVHLSQQSGQSLRQQASRCRLKLGEVPLEGLAGLTRAAPDLENTEKRTKVKGRRYQSLVQHCGEKFE